MMVNQFKVYCKRLLVQDFKKTLEVLDKIVDENSEHFNNVILFFSRYNQVVSDFNQNIIPKQERDLSLDKLRVSLIKLLSDLEEKDLYNEKLQSYLEKINGKSVGITNEKDLSESNNEVSVEQLQSFIKGKLEAYEFFLNGKKNELINPKDEKLEPYNEMTISLIKETYSKVEFFDTSIRLNTSFETYYSYNYRDGTLRESSYFSEKYIVFDFSKISNVFIEKAPMDLYSIGTMEVYSLVLETFNSQKSIRIVSNNKKEKSKYFDSNYVFTFRLDELEFAEKIQKAFERLRKLFGAKDEVF